MVPDSAVVCEQGIRDEKLFDNALRTLLDIGFESPTAELMDFENDKTVWFTFARAKIFTFIAEGILSSGVRHYP
jgi:hypothetical protein